MRSNRTIQTIVQAVTLVLVAAIFFKLPDVAQFQGGAGGGRGAPSAPSEVEIKKRFRAYFSEDDEASTKAQLLSVGVQGRCLEGVVCHVKLAIELRWEGHNINYTKGPLKGAPGQRGDTVRYTEVFQFRYWGEKGWDIEGHRDPPIIQ